MAVGDDYLHTAVRELSEELGVTAEPEDFKFIGMRDSVVKDTFHGKQFTYMRQIFPKKSSGCRRKK